jgi:parallel beta-helix repeat protein
MKNSILLFIAAITLFLIYSCEQKEAAHHNWLKAGEDDQKTVQTALINASPGDTIFFDEGIFKFTGSLTLLDVDSVTLLGKGMDKTIFDFSEQTEGAEGVKVVANHFTIQDIAIIDVKGDGIKVQAAYGVVFRRLRVEWTKDGDSTNGAYGIYPVMCKNVLLEECIARGASDAGIYVGQSENAIVRKNLVERNVAGIEIENTINSEVYENTVQNNTGGIMIFDLPDLPKKNGKNYRVYNNIVKDNNHFNFSPEGISVSMVPAGVGLLFMATSHVEAFGNKVINNNTVGCAVLNLDAMGKGTRDTLYDKYPSAMYIHDNEFERAKVVPDTTRPFGKVLLETFGENLPVFLFDGSVNPKYVVNGKVSDDRRICIQNNKGATFFNLATQSTELGKHDCFLSVVPATTFIWDGVKPEYIEFKPSSEFAIPLN